MSAGIFIFLLVGCNFEQLNQNKPFTEISFSCEGNSYQIKIPADMPDFVQFKNIEFVPLNSFVGLLNFYTPDGAINQYGSGNHYRLIVNMLPGECPGILILMTVIGNQNKFWLWDVNGDPYSVTTTEGEAWLETWYEKTITGEYDKMLEEEVEEKTTFIKVEIDDKVKKKEFWLTGDEDIKYGFANDFISK